MNKLTVTYFAGDNTDDAYDAFTDDRKSIRVNFGFGDKLISVLLIVVRSRKKWFFTTLSQSGRIYISSKQQAIEVITLSILLSHETRSINITCLIL